MSVMQERAISIDTKQQEKSLIQKRKRRENVLILLSLLLVLGIPLGLGLVMMLVFQDFNLIMLGIDLFLFLFLFILYWAFHFSYQIDTLRLKQDWFKKYGKTVQAKILEHRVRETNDDYSYDLVAGWKDEESGKEYLFTENTSKLTLQRFPLGNTISVSFDPDDPSFYLVHTV